VTSDRDPHGPTATATCICPPHQYGGGPEEDCPKHGSDALELDRPWCTDCGQPLTPAPDEQTTGLCPACRWGAGQ
jgi:hypothetical protein